MRRAASRPELSLDVKALASLYSGYLPPGELARLGMLSGSPEALAAAAATFAGPAPWLPERY